LGYIDPDDDEDGYTESLISACDVAVRSAQYMGWLTPCTAEIVTHYFHGNGEVLDCPGSCKDAVAKDVMSWGNSILASKAGAIPCNSPCGPSKHIYHNALEEEKGRNPGITSNPDLALSIGRFRYKQLAVYGWAKCVNGKNFVREVRGPTTVSYYKEAGCCRKWWGSAIGVTALEDIDYHLWNNYPGPVTFMNNCAWLLGELGIAKPYKLKPCKATAQVNGCSCDSCE
jgi:hypothetical protein